MRKYKKISDCPIELQLVIDLVNRLPALGDNSNESGIKLRDIITSELFAKYEVYGDIRDLYEAKPRLIAISQVNKKEMDEYGKNAFTKSGMPLDDKRIYLQEKIDEGHVIDATYTLDDKGNLRPRISGLGRLFEKYNIPVIRIRSCPICERIFWAKRLDAKSCGTKQCSDLFSQRNLRAQKSDEINKRRRENYKRNKHLELVKARKNNGTL